MLVQSAAELLFETSLKLNPFTLAFSSGVNCLRAGLYKK